jgi:hypothetical protein
LTQGVPLGPLGFFPLLNPRQGVITAIGRGKSKPVIGQVRQNYNSSSARVSFLMPTDALDAPVLPGVLEYMAYQAGQEGALHVTADVDESLCVFEGLRRAGFSVFAWQRVWKFEAMTAERNEPQSSPSSAWQPFQSRDDLGPIRALYQSLVPSLVQPMETSPDKHLRGLVYRRDGELLAYANLEYGPAGIYALPYIHPAVEDAMEVMAEMLRSIPARARRPVYICVRSYQSWFESSLEEMNGNRGPRQALMVKHLAVSQRVVNALRIPGLENGPVQNPTPVANVDLDASGFAENRLAGK